MTATDLRSGKTHRDENFPVASWLVAAKNRPPILAFYDFVRTADDIADADGIAPDDKHHWLDRLEGGLDGTNDEPVAFRLRHILRERGLEDRHARDLLAAFRHDVDTPRTATFDDLMGYCALSAMPVGRFVLDVHGEDRSLYPASDAICAALQIINHLQDCGKDWCELRRCYLPDDLMATTGAHVEDLGKDSLTPALRRTIDTIIERTSLLLDQGEGLATSVRDPRLACEIAVIVAAARRILDLLRKGDPLRGGVHLHKLRAATIALVAIAREAARRLRHGPGKPFFQPEAR